MLTSTAPDPLALLSQPMTPAAPVPVAAGAATPPFAPTLAALLSSVTMPAPQPIAGAPAGPIAPDGARPAVAASGKVLPPTGDALPAALIDSALPAVASLLAADGGGADDTSLFASAIVEQDDDTDAAAEPALAWLIAPPVVPARNASASVPMPSITLTPKDPAVELTLPSSAPPEPVAMHGLPTSLIGASLPSTPVASPIAAKESVEAGSPSTDPVPDRKALVAATGPGTASFASSPVLGTGHAPSSPDIVRDPAVSTVAPDLRRQGPAAVPPTGVRGPIAPMQGALPDRVIAQNVAPFIVATGSPPQPSPAPAAAAPGSFAAPVSVVGPPLPSGPAPAAVNMASPPTAQTGRRAPDESVALPAAMVRPAATAIARAPETIRPAVEPAMFALRPDPLVPTGSEDRPLLTPASVPLAPQAAAAAPVAAPTGGQQAGIDLTRDPGLHRMIDRIEMLRDAANANDTRIRLIPDALGPVEVSVRRDGDAVQVRFTAQQEATRQLIADATPRLTELAEARGVRIDRTSVEAGPNQGTGQHWGESARQPAWAQQNQPGRPASAVPTHPDEDAVHQRPETRIA